MTGTDFTRIFLPLRESLYKVAFYILESETDAEDALQDLYLKLWARRDALDSLNNPKAYCISLLKNLCIDRIRAKKDFADSGKMEIRDSGSIEESLNQKQMLQQVHKAMELLSKREALILRLHVFEGLDYKEIQQETGIDPLSSRVLLSGARKKLKNCIRYEKN